MRPAKLQLEDSLKSWSSWAIQIFAGAERERLILSDGQCNAFGPLSFAMTHGAQPCMHSKKKKRRRDVLDCWSAGTATVTRGIKRKEIFVFPQLQLLIILYFILSINSLTFDNFMTAKRVISFLFFNILVVVLFESVF